MRENIKLLNIFIEEIFELFELLCENSLIIVAGVRFVRVKLIIIHCWGIEIYKCLLNIYNLFEYFNNDKYWILRISLFILIKYIFLRENHATLIWCKDEIWRWINWSMIERCERWRFFWRKRDILIYILIISNKIFLLHLY